MKKGKIKVSGRGEKVGERKKGVEQERKEKVNGRMEKELGKGRKSSSR